MRQESEFIKRVEDFARYRAPEYLKDSEQPRSLCIIAADCLDAKAGKHAMAHIMVGNNHVGRCALRSMMEDVEAFSAQVHELCDEDGGNRSVEDFDEEIGAKQKWLRRLYALASVAVAWMLTILITLCVGLGSWWLAVSNIFLMLAVFANLYGQIRPLRSQLNSLRQQRKRAAGRQKIMNRISSFGEFLRQMRAQMEEDAGEDDDDEE